MTRDYGNYGRFIIMGNADLYDRQYIAAPHLTTMLNSSRPRPGKPGRRRYRLEGIQV